MTVTFFDCNSIPKDRKHENLTQIVLLILKFNDDKKPIWYGKIKETLVPTAMAFNEFECAFTHLEDYGFIYREAGSLGEGRAGFHWHINKIHIPNIRAGIKASGIEWK